MNNMDDIYGLDFDRGKARALIKVEKSQKTAAITQQGAEVDFRWGGRAITTVRLTPKTDDWVFGLDLMANKTTELSLYWQRFVQAEYPGDRLPDLEKVLDAASAEGTFPCIVHRPVESLISSGIGRNSGVIRALVGAPEAPTFVGSLFCHLSPTGQAHALPAGWQAVFDNGEVSEEFRSRVLDNWVIGDVTVLRTSVFNNLEEGTVTVLVPLEEGGVAPFMAHMSQGMADVIPASDESRQKGVKDNIRKSLDSEWQYADAGTLKLPIKLLKPLRMAITYVQSDVRIASPVKSLVAGAAINHLLQYFAGKRVSAGAHVFQKGQTPLDITRRLLGYMYQNAVDSYMFHPVENFWSGDDAQLIQAIIDFCYAMDHQNELIRALGARPEVTLFADTLVLSGLSRYTTSGRVTAPPVDTEFAEWLVENILSLYALGPEVIAQGAPVQNGLPPRDRQGKFKPRSGMLPIPGLNLWMEARADPAPASLTDAERAAWDAVYGRPANANALPQNYNMDLVGPDYVASTLLSMLRNAIPVLLKALRGEWPGMPVIQYQDSMVDLDVTVSLLEALEYALRMDVTTQMAKAQYTLPYKQLFWASMYATFTCRIPRREVPYAITNLAYRLQDEATALGTELETSAKLLRNDNGELELRSLSEVFSYGGFSYLRYGPDVTEMVRGMYGLGRNAFVNLEGAATRSDRIHWLTNAPLAHGDVEISIVMPCWDAAAWRVHTDYMQAQTLKTYFAFPVTNQLCRQNIVRYRPANTPRWLRRLMARLGIYAPIASALDKSLEISLSYPSMPALFDIALLIPYIREYEHQKLVAQDLDHSMQIELDADQGLWNMNGTLVLPESRATVPDCHVADWRVAAFDVGFAGKRTPSGVYSMPVVFNAQR